MNVIRSTLLALILLSQVSYAVKMDETTHDMVISRLEMGIDGMAKDEPERTGIILRLADLYADRARLKAMNEMDANCKDCKGAQKDREKAISLYQDALPKTAKEEQGKVVLQIAHLYALNDENSKANRLYNQILNAKKGTYASEVRAIAFMQVAEIKFRKGNFKGALQDFESARKENLRSRALVESRIAWCYLNMGKDQKAIATLVHLLKSPELLATQTNDDKSVDASFVQDVTHDLAAFLAHSNVGPNQIDLLKELSPAGSRKTNLHTLATETDRLGKKSSALIVWAAYVDEGDVKPNEKIEVQTRVARIYYDMGKQEFAANAYEKALFLWKKMGCTDANLCDDLKERLRGFVMAWNKGQKKKPTANLLRAYVAYVDTFPTDTEMLHWGAIVAKDLNKPKVAALLFHRAAVQAAIDLQKEPNKKELKNIYEGSLLAEIEMAEASKDSKAREAAYNYYLQMDPNGSQAFEIRYQRAHLYAESGRNQEAFSEFHYLASQPINDHRDLRVKSADLALDSLVALKDDKNLQVRSLEYARFFPERKDEYMKISRKATMNIVAGNLKNEKTSDSTDYKANLAALATVKMDGADDAEKIKFYKNKIVIAQKALDLGTVRNTSVTLLGVKSLGEEDREWAMEQEAWAAELELNFAEAYHISEKMKMSELSPADRELRMALLASLAGIDSRKHDEAYLRVATNVRSANLVRVTLVKNAGNPWRELDRQLKFLKQTPDLLAGLTLEVFASHKDFNKAEHLLKTTNIGRYAAGQTLDRHLKLKEFYAFDHKIRSHRIYGYNDQVMAKSLKERLKLLGEADKNAQTAFRKHDWTLETLNLTVLARENRRIYHDIQSLPIPRRLNAQERARYKQLLTSQAGPYLGRAEKIETELSEMWNKGDSVQNLQATYMTSTPALQKLYRDEILPLAQSAPPAAKSRLQTLLTSPQHRPSQREILTARRELQANPFDVSKAEHLRELESHSGRPAMVVYLDERIAQMKKGKTL